MSAKVKIAVVTEEKDTPCWPCINYDFDKELKRVLEPVYEMNQDIEFTVSKYTDRSQTEADYDYDLKTYDGVLVLLMTCWKQIDWFYARQAKNGIPTIIADVPFCGSGSILANSAGVIKSENLPVALISSLDFTDIAKAMRVFAVIHKMKNTNILVISNTPDTEAEKAAEEIWGCRFTNISVSEFNKYFEKTDRAKAEIKAQEWIDGAAEIMEPSFEELVESARIYYALSEIKKDVKADAVTVDCLNLSYDGCYSGKSHMYPCLSHFEMLNNGEIAVCEADINATLSAVVTKYLTGRPGYVSDPVIDTSSDQIIYSHCVACTNVYGCKNATRSKYYLRSHAEDKLGASVQVIFPTGDKLTTTLFDYPNNRVCIHSAKAVGNMSGDEGCRSKLAATAEAEKLLYGWMPRWHRVTVFGDYRKLFMQLFKVKGIEVIEEDK